MSDEIGAIRIDRSLKSYEGFYSHEWAQNLLALCAGSRLDMPVSSLLLYWKAVSLAHQMPWRMVNAIKHFGRSFANGRGSLGAAITRAVTQRIIDELRDPLSRSMRSRLAHAVERIAMGVASIEQIASDAATSDAQWAELWDGLIDGSDEFGLSLWGSQQLCYSGVFFGYENFIRECVALAIGRSSQDRMPIGEIVSAAARTRSAQTIAYCLKHECVTIARFARNALVHNGGQLTPDLRAKSHPFTVEGDKLQIMAIDTRMLYHELQDRAYRWTVESMGLPQMKC